MIMLKQVLITMCLLFGAMSISAQSAETDNKEEYKKEVREKLQLDYSLPDYSTSRIDEKVMGLRLAKLLKQINDTYTQYMNLSALSVIQSNQVEGLSYGRVKTIKLNKVTKQGNEIVILYNTVLDNNNLNLKKSKIEFRFIDGVSEETATNDFFSNLCRYMKN